MMSKELEPSSKTEGEALSNSGFGRLVNRPQILSQSFGPVLGFAAFMVVAVVGAIVLRPEVALVLLATLAISFAFAVFAIYFSKGDRGGIT